MKDVFIISAKRTPIGSFGGVFNLISAPRLGATAIEAAIADAGIDPKVIDEVFMGNVLSAGVGQAPARQASIFAGIPDTVPCTTVNKVCASGMKALMLGASQIKAGEADVVVCGGMENMSRVPFYLNGARDGFKLGDQKLKDGMVLDGLTDVYNDYHMGLAAELCASECNVSREEQDAYALESYERSRKAWDSGKFDKEICSVKVPQRRGDDLEVTTDEEFTNVKPEKVPSLRPVFKKDGSVTAANASTLNDGAAAFIIASKEAVEKHGLKPIAKLLSYADASQEPEWFTTAPSKAIPKAIEKSGLAKEDIDYYEINEAFSVVSIANVNALSLDLGRVNINGGAVSLGHPLGCSGARIVVTLLHVLEQNKAKFGVAGICNGGGGASALVIEKV